MPARERRKGSSGESEVRALLERYGFAVDALQRNRGDELDSLAYGYGISLAVETKRCEVLRVPAWTRQAAAGAPPGFVPLVAYRRNREPWYAVLELEHLLTLVHAFGVERTRLERELHAAHINVSALRGALSRAEDHAARSASDDAGG